MPRRSNKFQDLIELLERQLAPIGAKVSASQLLKDARTGDDREVDIVIETTSGIHPLRIGIEVIDRKRPADGPWMEGIAKKHEDLPIDKSIAVSRSGFYRPALIKAEAYKIDALTVNEVTELDWKAKIDSIPSVRLESFLLPYLTNATIIFGEASSVAEFEGRDISGLALYTPEGDSRGSVLSVLERMLARQEVVDKVREKAFTDAGTVIEGGLRLPEGSYVVGLDGGRHKVSEIAFTAKCKKEVTEAELLKGRYRDTAVILASGGSFGHPVQMAFSETPEDESPQVAVRIKKTRGD